MALTTGWGGVGLSNAKQTDEARSLWATVEQSGWCTTLIHSVQQPSSSIGLHRFFIPLNGSMVTLTSIKEGAAFVP